MKNIIYNVLQFIRKLLFGKTDLPDINTAADVTFVHELVQALKDFRMQNYLLPLAYSKELENFAQEKSNFNYIHSDLSDSHTHSIIQLHLRMNGVNLVQSDMLSIKTDGTWEDCFREITTNQKYRGALLDGKNMYLGIGKCEKYISVLVAG
jgi:hypothetical protein